MLMDFKVILQQEEYGGYIVSCPALPGCHSQGDSLDEALENIKEAIVGCLESLRDEFMAETLQAISELDLGLAKTYSGKKKFLDDLERL